MTCGSAEGGVGDQGSFKDQLIGLGSLFVISGNPLEPGTESRPDNQGKQEDGGGDERMSVHLQRPGGTILTPPLGRPQTGPEAFCRLCSRLLLSS